MAGNLDTLQNDPQFKALPPERQQALLGEAKRRSQSPSGGKGYPDIASPSETAQGFARGSYDVAKGLFVPKNETDAFIQMGLMAPELKWGAKALGQMSRIKKGLGLLKETAGELPEVAAEAESLATRMATVPERTPRMISHADSIEADVMKMLNKSERKLIEGPSPLAISRKRAMGTSQPEIELGEDAVVREKPAAVPPSARLSPSKGRRVLEPPAFKGPRRMERLLKSRVPGSIALGATSGAVGSTLEGKGPVAGAERGGIVGGASGLLSAGASKAGSYFGEKKIVDSGIKSFGDWLKGKFGNSKLYGPLVGSMKNATDFYREFGAGALERRLGQRVGELNHVIGDQFSRRLFSVPLLDGGTERIPFDHVPDYIRALEDRAWSSATGKSLGGINARKYRDVARATLDSVAAQMDNIEPGVGYFWRQARRDYGGVRLMTRKLKEANVFGGSEGVDWPEVQAVISDNLSDLRSMFGEDADNMLRASLRGAQPPATDVASRSGHMRLHPRITSGEGVIPSFALPHVYKAVGRTPISVNPPPWMMVPAARAGYEELEE